MPGPTRAPRGALSWALYDLANTVYSMNVLTLFFAQWVTVDRGREDLWYSLFFSASMALVALTLPYLGLRSDRTGRRLGFLAVFTGASVGATALLGFLTRASGLAGLLAALAVFAISNYAFQGALVFYNALLPTVSTPETRGRVSGLGVALGYVGSFVGMILVTPFVTGTVPILNLAVPGVHAGGRTAAFLPTAIFFALFSLPVFLRVREPRRAPAAPLPSFPEALTQILATLADARRYPGVFRFLIANLLLVDAIQTVIIFMAVYAQKVMGLPDSAKVTFFMLATVPAIGGSFLAGWLADRLGARRVLTATAWLWVASLVAVAATPSRAVFYVIGGVVGALLGAVWTTSRPLLLALTPPGEEGRLFGLYAFSNKAAAIVGPLLWGATVLVAEPMGPARYRLAVGVLAVMAAAGATLFLSVPERRSPEG